LYNFYREIIVYWWYRSSTYCW